MYQSLSKLGFLVEQINNAIDEDVDPLEIEELISQYTQAQENETDSFQAAISFSEKEVSYIDEQIKALQSQKKLVQNRINVLEKCFINYIKLYGELVGTVQKIKGNFFTYSIVKKKRVKQDLTVSEVPERFRKFKIENWLTQKDINHITENLNIAISTEDSIDKVELSKFAKESSQEHIFLEENEYYAKR